MAPIKKYLPHEQHSTKTKNKNIQATENVTACKCKNNGEGNAVKKHLRYRLKQFGRGFDATHRCTKLKHNKLQDTDD